ncbi:hypothetical protein NDU88_004727 [Pleurodeles waltl]|uniref:Uncharacterized protein n=1 Tax=Pleurodeles waltl TaxID=8319 RepID=A0AAV7V3U3_PLEWA|nr:hypothetical protein NDU88_004727 [Pleurodeles waltl]
MGGRAQAGDNGGRELSELRILPGLSGDLQGLEGRRRPSGVGPGPRGSAACRAWVGGGRGLAEAPEGLVCQGLLEEGARGPINPLGEKWSLGSAKACGGGPPGRGATALLGGSQAYQPRDLDRGACLGLGSLPQSSGGLKSAIYGPGGGRKEELCRAVVGCAALAAALFWRRKQMGPAFGELVRRWSSGRQERSEGGLVAGSGAGGWESVTTGLQCWEARPPNWVTERGRGLTWRARPAT